MTFQSVKRTVKIVNRNFRFFPEKPPLKTPFQKPQFSFIVTAQDVNRLRSPKPSNTEKKGIPREHSSPKTFPHLQNIPRD